MYFLQQQLSHTGRSMRQIVAYATFGVLHNMHFSIMIEFFFRNRSSCIEVACPAHLSCVNFKKNTSNTVAWPTGVQLLVFFCSSVPVVLFDTPGISRCRSQHVSVESSSLLHHSIYLWFICFTWWSIDELENLHADRTTVCFEPW